MRELAEAIGFRKAVKVYQASAWAVRDILDLVRTLQIRCDCYPRPSLYLAGSELGPRELADEGRLREKAGFPSSLISAADLARYFGFRSAAALYQTGGAEADPVRLARGLLAAAITRGVRLFTPVSATAYDLSEQGATVLTDLGHEIAAKQLVLANGYEMPSFVPSRIHSIVSTWVVAASNPPWPEKALVWGASDPYLYMRSTADGHIIIGGEDEEITDADERDGKIAAKAKTLVGKFQSLRPGSGRPAAVCAWAGFFGKTSDGLPIIGRLPGHGNVFAAFGYGGNGITFSALAASLVSDLICGRASPILETFAVER